MTDEKRSRIKELEEMLSYLVNGTMTVEQKLKSLSNAYWEASNSGYGDHLDLHSIIRRQRQMCIRDS